MPLSGNLFGAPPFAPPVVGGELETLVTRLWCAGVVSWGGSETDNSVENDPCTTCVSGGELGTLVALVLRAGVRSWVLWTALRVRLVSCDYSNTSVATI